MIKAATEKMGKVDTKGFADALHGLTITAAKEPGILMDATFDANGDIDRTGFPRRGRRGQAGRQAGAAEARQLRPRVLNLSPLAGRGRSRAGARLRVRGSE